MQSYNNIDELQGYIDMHCHIIPHVDDGAKSSEQALNMVSIAYKNGGVKCKVIII